MSNCGPTGPEIIFSGYQIGPSNSYIGVTGTDVRGPTGIGMCTYCSQHAGPTGLSQLQDSDIGIQHSSKTE